LRLLALTILLLRAGSGLDLEALRRLQGVLLRLAFLPNLAEAITVAVVAYFMLGLPPLWCPVRICDRRRITSRRHTGPAGSTTHTIWHSQGHSDYGAGCSGTI